MRKKWTEQETEEFAQLYPTTLSKDLAKRFKCSITQIYGKANKHGLSKDKNWLHQYYKDNYQGHPATQFKKGMSGWNKGMKGLQIGGVQTQFKKGATPHNTKPIGYRSYRDGYLVERVAKGFEFVHVMLWRKHYGEIPPGLFVVFKDRNKENITIDNLELINRKQLMRRNSIVNFPDELREVINIKRQITRKVNSYGKKQD